MMPWPFWVALSPWPSRAVSSGPLPTWDQKWQPCCKSLSPAAQQTTALGSATIRYLNRIFAAFSEPVAGHDAAAQSPVEGTAVGLVEPLTEREMEVLALLDRRLTNQEIARELTIAVGTVKVHTSNIYAKLGVGDRRLVVARARSLGLLPPG